MKQITDLKKEVETKISDSLNESNSQLSVFESQSPTFSTPQEAIQHWKGIFDKLSIAGIDDKEGYNKVTKAIAIVRTTRTTLGKLRKEDKDYYLEAGRQIDRSYNSLIELIEPIESDLKLKKEAIDNEIEAEKQRKAEEKKLKIEARAKQLIDLKFVFNGSGYSLRNVTVGTGEIETITDGVWNDFISGPATNAFNEQIAEEAEFQRLKEEEQERERIRLRTESRKQKLVDAGYEFKDGIYARLFQSDSLKQEKGADDDVVLQDFISNASDEAFTEVLKSAATDVIQAQKELKDKHEAFVKQQKEIAEREAEIKRKEEAVEQEKKRQIEEVLKQENQRIHNERLAEIRIVSSKEFNQLNLLTEQEFKKLILVEKEAAALEEKRRQIEIQDAIAKKEAEEEKKRIAEAKKLEKEEKRKPEKQKLLEYADKLELLPVPELVELKDYADSTKAKVMEIVEHIRVSFGQ